MMPVLTEKNGLREGHRVNEHETLVQTSTGWLKQPEEEKTERKVKWRKLMA